jgi:hypothetical protein
MTKNDRQALQLAMTQWCAEDKEFASKLKEETWEKVAKDAAWHCQIRSLNLNPWESAPCEIHDPDNLTPGHNPPRSGGGPQGSPTAEADAGQGN